MRTHPAQRRAMLAKTAIAVKQLGLDDETFRAMLRNLFGRESRKELNDHELALLCDHLATLGASFTAKDTPREGKPFRRKAAGRRSDWYEIPEGPLAPLKRKIAAMWRELGYDMTSLDTRVRRSFGVDAFRWLEDERHLRTLLADLETRLHAQRRKGQA